MSSSLVISPTHSRCGHSQLEAAGILLSQLRGKEREKVRKIEESDLVIKRERESE